ncbi:VrrA/YqfQ family protein [Bacillus sp. REN10]|uniref:VrrA/YqfQ family protein n=1 Tax=Bacillus sp. REN10 TaxID=2782541 RepID=UPI00193C34CA|nr:VrrA/YqfQ family protein [Bacillus sp. REN10]
MPPFSPRPPQQQQPFFYGQPMRPYPTNRPSLSPQRMGRGQGGLLSRLLNRQGTSSTPLTGFERQGAATAGSSTAQQLANPMNFQQMLSNTQQVLQTVQQMGPLVEQYGPLVKNLPAMWKLYRGLKSLPDADKDNDENTKETAKNLVKNEESLPAPSSAAASKKPKPEKSDASTNGTSIPKLYV